MCHMCLLEMIILCSLLTGMTVAEVTHVFRTFGENVRLPCNNAFPGCTSTTWNYNRHSETVELIAGGKKKNNIERRERLSVGSDCSLNIKKVTQEDYGLYTCRQYVNGKQGTDARVYLHFLHVSSSSSQTEIRPGSSVTLSCQLYYERVSCDTLVRTDGIELIWVNQAGVSVMTDSRYQISFSSTHCISTLTTTLLNEDLNREWRCQVTQRNQLKTSATYTVKYSASNETKTTTPVTNLKTTTTVNKPVTSRQSESATSSALILATTSNSEKKTGPTAPPPPEKLDNRRGTNDFLVTNMKKYNGTNDTINISIHPTASANEQQGNVTYAEVVTYSKNPAKNNKVHVEDKVTYASIRGATAGPQDNCSQLYASVNKNCHK
ncbi:uncharacterized protein LOC127497988 isoform X2 [Ctenopharyngodon idella]|uniref:uncharacterized protein LOC127497988 isoform X2 n=1 Tax=Ctenopharyngodon idella TaxID=7959 RepID=UPI002232C12A|nr:uncharacterized protein LOC127497988 isoform X2 [Ctenopharyngodon idella]